jgi:hypothetical protein
MPEVNASQLTVLGFWLWVFELLLRLFILCYDATMPKTHFENLRVYQLSERLSDEVWSIAAKWDDFTKRTIGAHWCVPSTASERTLRKEADAGAIPTTNDS